MKNRTWLAMTLLLACKGMLAQSAGPALGRQLQISLHNGVSSLVTSSALDSVYFVKAGYQAGLEGNYYWNNFGLAGSIGYFSNAANRQALEDFARTRKAPRDRVLISGSTNKGMYFFTGPAFQSVFNKWRLQSSLEAGLISKPSGQVLIGDNTSRDVVYYRNVFDNSSSFAWSAGLSLSYALSSQISLGINADYLNTKNEVVNYDILRGGGHDAKNITSQSGLVNTGIKLSYLFNTIKSREAGSGIATGKRTANDNGVINSIAANTGKALEPQTTQQKPQDTCRCQDKVMEVYEMEPYVVEIQFATVQEAKAFLDTYEPLLSRREVGSGMATGKRYANSNPLYQDKGTQGNPMSQNKSSGNNPLYEDKGTKGDNPLFQGKNAQGTNPLYEGSGTQGTNPLYQKSNRSIATAQGSRGIVHADAQGQQAFYVLPTAIDLSEILSLEDGRVTVHVQSGSSKGDAGMSSREAGSGIATGRRTYKAITVGDLDGDGLNDLMLQSSNGVISPRDHATGQASGKRISKIDAFTVKQGIVIEADLDGDGEFEPLQQVDPPRDVSSGQSGGRRMAKQDVYVWKIKYTGDLDGDGMPDGFVCSGMNRGADLFGSASKEFSISLQDDDGTGNAKAVEKATSGVKQTMQTQVLIINDNPNDNSTTTPTQKTGISTSRSNIRTKKIMSCGDGACVMSCEIELDGQVYNALITARSKHDTAKNAIGNIR